MKKFALFPILLFLTLLGFSQNDFPQFLRGSWELVSLRGPESDYRTDAVVGNRWHFVDVQHLILENEHGTLRLPFRMEGDRLIVQNREYPLQRDGDDVFQLADYTGDVLSTVTFKRLPDATVPELVLHPSTWRGYRLGGFYFSEEMNGEETLYHYYRFYATGELLHASSTLAPTDMEPFLNRAYLYRDALGWDVLNTVPEEASGQVYRKSIVPPFSSEGETLITTSQLTPQGEGLMIDEVIRWAHAERTYEQTFDLSFYPSTQLLDWQGQELLADEPGRADELFLIRPFPRFEMTNGAPQEMPRFPGCEDEQDIDKRKMCAQRKLLEFIYRNIKYPAIARENGVQGTVVVTYVIEKDGSISDARVIRDIGGGCGEESLRVVNMMSDQGLIWTPGRMYGEPVRVQFNLPVKFRLEGRTRKPRKRRRDRG